MAHPVEDGRIIVCGPTALAKSSIAASSPKALKLAQSQLSVCIINVIGAALRCSQEPLSLRKRLKAFWKSPRRSTAHISRRDEEPDYVNLSGDAGGPAVLVYDPRKRWPDGVFHPFDNARHAARVGSFG
jgi:hypothetical protein